MGDEAVQFFGVKNIDLIDVNKLARQLPKASARRMAIRTRYIGAILRSYDTMKRYGIDNPLRLAHFLGQGIYETGWLGYDGENLKYSADGLLKIFGKYFPDRETAKEYEYQPERIANRVYANRMGNGDEASGDGWRYRGRGFFQLTGKNNYRKFGEMSGIDLLGDPDIIQRDLKKSVEVAAAYFGKTGLGKYADANDAAAVSRGVNRGNPNSRYAAHGEDDRVKWTNEVLQLTGDPGAVLDDGVLRSGDGGPKVTALQNDLIALGYDLGAADGDFGKKTRRALLAFQAEHGLDPTGEGDEATLSAIEDALDAAKPAQPTELEIASETDAKRRAGETVTANGGVGVAGAGAAAAAGAGVLEETGVLEQAGKVADQLTGTEEDETTVAETSVAPIVEPAPVEETSDWFPIIVFSVILIVGVYVLLRARHNSKKRVERFRLG
ncbi:MAG: peptidoglycan-binding protein [Pseudomonadota bacterium]